MRLRACVPASVYINYLNRTFATTKKHTLRSNETASKLPEEVERLLLWPVMATSMTPAVSLLGQLLQRVGLNR
jgi:hypothetical protein